MRVLPIPVLRDNYSYLLIDPTSNEALVVDPAEAAPVVDRAEQERVRLVKILNTHHHLDHTGGNEELAARIPGIEVLGSVTDAPKIPGITRQLRDGDSVELGGLRGRALFVPCHTSGHLAFQFEKTLFTGDTLFAGGCGRFFEGTAAEMYHALYEVIGALPDDTMVYCGHEYTEANLSFAAKVEPDNPAVAEKLREVRALRARNEPSIPTSLAGERSYNPFLRVTAPGIKKSVREAFPDVDPEDSIAVLAALRELKNRS